MDKQFWGGDNMEWFKTWNVLEYKEWAQKADYGYLLVIIKKEGNSFRCAKAKLMFKEKGLPEFIQIMENIVNSEYEAEKQIKKWM
jgi:hypothetical protein